MIESIKQWSKENEEQYYGLDRETVNDILFKFEDLIGGVEGLKCERDYFESVSNQHYDKWRKSVVQVEELQKALERSKSQ